MNTRQPETTENGTLQDGTLQERADALFDELSAVLRHGPADALSALRAADRAFDALHVWMREGNPLPRPWAAHQAFINGGSCL